MTDTDAAIAEAQPGTRLRLYLERSHGDETRWVYFGRRARRVMDIGPTLERGPRTWPLAVFYRGKPFQPRRGLPKRPQRSLLCALGIHAVRRDLAGEFRPCSDCGWEAGR